MSTTYAYYTLSGLICDPEEVTTASGVTPSKVWRVGDLVLQQGLRRHQVNGWQVQSQLDAEAEPGEHVASLLNQLTPGWTYLSHLGQEVDSYIECVVYIRDAQGPPVVFTAETMHRFVELNVSLALDLYCLKRPVAE